MEIHHAQFPEDAAVVLDIWREFIAYPETDLSYQNYEAEFADLPGKFAEPAGCVLLVAHP